MVIARVLLLATLLGADVCAGVPLYSELESALRDRYCVAMVAKAPVDPAKQCSGCAGSKALGVCNGSPVAARGARGALESSDLESLMSVPVSCPADQGYVGLRSVKFSLESFAAPDGCSACVRPVASFECCKSPFYSATDSSVTAKEAIAGSWDVKPADRDPAAWRDVLDKMTTCSGYGKCDDDPHQVSKMCYGVTCANDEVVELASNRYVDGKTDVEYAEQNWNSPFWDRTPGAEEAGQTYQQAVLSRQFTDNYCGTPTDNIRRLWECRAGEVAEKAIDTDGACNIDPLARVCPPDGLLRSFQTTFLPAVPPEGTVLPATAAGTAACEDQDAKCPSWAANGECSTNPGYMEQTCALACGLCPEEAYSLIIPGKDSLKDPNPSGQFALGRGWLTQPSWQQLYGECTPRPPQFIGGTRSASSSDSGFIICGPYDDTPGVAAGVTLQQYRPTCPGFSVLSSVKVAAKREQPSAEQLGAVKKPEDCFAFEEQHTCSALLPEYSPLMMFTMDVLHALDPAAPGEPRSALADRLRGALARLPTSNSSEEHVWTAEQLSAEQPLIDGLAQNARAILLELETRDGGDNFDGANPDEPVRVVGMWSSEYLTKKMDAFLQSSVLNDASSQWATAQLMQADAKLAGGWAQGFAAEESAYEDAIQQGLKQLSTVFEDIKTITDAMKELQDKSAGQIATIKAAIDKYVTDKIFWTSFNLAVTITTTVFTLGATAMAGAAGGFESASALAADVEQAKRLAAEATDIKESLKALKDLLGALSSTVLSVKSMWADNNHRTSLGPVDPVNAPAKGIPEFFTPRDTSVEDNDKLMRALTQAGKIDVGMLGPWWDNLSFQTINTQLRPLYDKGEGVGAAASAYAVTVKSLSAYGKALTEKQVKALSIVAQMQTQAAMRGAFLKSQAVMKAIEVDSASMAVLKQGAIAHLLVNSAVTASFVLRDLCDNVVYQQGSTAFAPSLQPACASRSGNPALKLPPLGDYIALLRGEKTPVEFMQSYADGAAAIKQQLALMKPREVQQPNQLYLDFGEAEMKELERTGSFSFRMTPELLKGAADYITPHSLPKVLAWYPMIDGIDRQAEPPAPVTRSAPASRRLGDSSTCPQEAVGLLEHVPCDGIEAFGQAYLTPAAPSCREYLGCPTADGVVASSEPSHPHGKCTLSCGSPQSGSPPPPQSPPPSTSPSISPPPSIPPPPSSPPPQGGASGLGDHFMRFVLQLSSPFTLFSSNDPGGLAFSLPPFPGWNFGGVQQVNRTEQCGTFLHQKDEHSTINCYTIPESSFLAYQAARQLQTPSASYLLPSLFAQYTVTLQGGSRRLLLRRDAQGKLTARMRIYLIVGSDAQEPVSLVARRTLALGNSESPASAQEPDTRRKLAPGNSARPASSRARMTTSRLLSASSSLRALRANLTPQ